MKLAHRILRSHPEVPLCAAAALVLLVLGLVRPLLYVEKSFWDHEYSILDGTWELFRTGRALVALLVCVFVIVLPLLRLAVLLGIWFLHLRAADRRRALGLLDTLDKWSMVDVFALALFVVGVELARQVSTEVRPGAWWFGGGVLLSSLLTWRLRRLARDGAATARAPRATGRRPGAAPGPR